MEFSQDKKYYDDYKFSLHKKFERQLEYIEATYNFSLGEEFEIAVCKVLRSFLPNKYGICRGFVVNENHEHKGDDIIIYDQERFPTMRLLEKGDFSRKESIPVEAVYAYIEAKHTLDINLDNEEKCVFQTAVKQCIAVKELISRREETFSEDFDPYLKSELVAELSPGLPNRRNPAFGIILARYIAIKGNRLGDQQEINRVLIQSINKVKKNINSPDLIVSGNSNIISPMDFFHNANPRSIPFYIDSPTIAYGHHKLPNCAYGHFLATLGFVVDYIRLGKMPWLKMLNNHFV